MTLSRRDAIRTSSVALAGLSLGALTPGDLRAREIRAEELGACSPPAPPRQAWPDDLEEMELRDRVELPLNDDGSAPEHPESEAGPIEGVIWRYTDGEPPEIEYD